MKRLPFLLTPLLALASTLRAAEDPAALFVRRVLPLLQEKCLACHGKDESKIKGDLDLRTQAATLKGGESGDPAVVAGQPEKSPLYLSVTRQHADDWEPMPPKEADKLTAEQIGWIKEWIVGSAPWPDEARAQAIAQANAAKWSAEDGTPMKTSGGLAPEWTNRKYKPEGLWAYQPVKKPAAPGAGGNPIDAFLAAAKMSEEIYRITDQHGGVCTIGRTLTGGDLVFDNEAPAHRVFLEPFSLSTSLVSVAALRAFIDAGGYADARWWGYSAEAQAFWEQNGKKPKPTAFDGDDTPRTNVSWFESVAFCLWLAAETGLNISLPSESQWQRAAQGDDGREYPWGNAFDPKRCNVDASGFARTTPVTKYDHPLAHPESGCSPFGVADLSGNVWEWCLDA